MILNVKKILVVLSVIFVCLMVFSIGSQANESGAKSIKAALKKQWGKSNHPLRVPVIIVQRGYAVAGNEPPSGGSALLKQNNHGWQTLLCCDVNSTKKSYLVQASGAANHTEYLSAALMQAEVNLSKEDKAFMNSFKGIIDLLKVSQHHAN